MNDATHEAYSAYLRDLADTLLLRDWEVQLKRELTRDDCYAQCFVLDSEDHIIVYLHRDFWPGSTEDRREWLVHELLHAHFSRVERVVDQLADQWDENSACQFARKAHRNEVEVCVQKLARVIAPLLPLPPVVAKEGE